MVESLSVSTRIEGALPVELTKQFLRLGIYAEYRGFGSDAVIYELLNLQELLVSVFYIRKRKTLLERALLKTSYLNHLIDEIATNYNAFGLELIYDFPVLEAYALNSLILRESSNLKLNNLVKGQKKIRIRF